MATIRSKYIRPKKPQVIIPNAVVNAVVNAELTPEAAAAELDHATLAPLMTPETLDALMQHMGLRDRNMISLILITVEQMSRDRSDPLRHMAWIDTLLGQYEDGSVLREALDESEGA